VRAAAAIAPLGALAVASALTAGCGDEFSALLDSFPIALTRAPMGGGMAGDGPLIATASPPGTPGAKFPMLVSTGSALTLLVGPPVDHPATQKEGFDLLDPTNSALRGSFQNVSLLKLPLSAVGDGSILPGGILGGDILRNYSVDIRFGATCPGSTVTDPNHCSSVTFWGHLGPDIGFLEDSGYAVLRFSLFGGGEVSADGDPDFLGQRGPLVLQPTRVVFRTCAAPKPFAPTDPRDLTCCKEADAELLKTGVDLALMLDTGVGPLVLSRSAWTRVLAALTAQMDPAAMPAEMSGTLDIATWPTPIAAIWSTIPRFALVDNETGGATDPGPCVELARSRRIEQVSVAVQAAEAMQMPTDVCTQPCDNDVREPDKSQNSAAYLELNGLNVNGLNVPIAVAVIADEEPYLQGLRFDVRPEGPELDGVVGAGALGRSRVEIDYASDSKRAVFSCELGVMRAECWAAARCPRLPKFGDTHFCFGLPAHGRAANCAPSTCQ
jgi:hypothetical protein